MSTETAPPPLRRHALNGPAMGSRWSCVFWAGEGFDVAALGRDLQAAVDRVEQQMSTWRADSDLERLNATPVGEWMPVPKALMTVLATALEMSRLSEGAFDIGVGDLVQAWGFGGGAHIPDARRIAELEGRPTFAAPRTLQLDPPGGRARRLAPLRLDLSGIAKGFGVDELARAMRVAGLSSWLVGIDGEMRAEGRKPDGRPWTIAHEKPDAAAREILGILELSGAAVATSGGYRHQARIGNRLVSHTMDPRRAAPIETDLAAVTVLAGTCMAADAWATALLVTGAEQGSVLARRLGLAALLVRADGSVNTTWPPEDARHLEDSRKPAPWRNRPSPCERSMTQPHRRINPATGAEASKSQETTTQPSWARPRKTEAADTAPQSAVQKGGLNGRLRWQPIDG